MKQARAMNRETLITDIRQLTVDLLEPLVQAAIEEAATNLSLAESGASVATVLRDDKESIRGRFGKYLGFGFDELAGIRTRKIELADYPSLSVVDAQFVEAANALEGMINYARNINIQALISFNTRLDELLDDQTIDETNSPLDPDRVAVAFVDALAPLEIDQQYILPIYRCFNQRVLHQLDQLLQKANDICIAAGLLPGLIVNGRSREAHLGKRSSIRPTSSPLERAFSEPGTEEEYLVTDSSAQLSTLIRELLWSPSDGLKSGSGTCNLVKEVAVPTAAMVARYFPGSLVCELGVMPLIAEPDMWIAGREVVQI
ncbi:MAG: DUF1631 domain-containing protein, partial [Gammaproteobacteria bacterium]|nr:DUF1631 domain-containing protein [Gammaproteobacteria bacterium]